MPEGDTIHHAARRMREVLQARVPQEILMPHPRHARSSWPERLRGRAVTAVDAHGKHLFLRFEGGLTFHSHLRMTGHWDVYRQGERWRRSARRAWLVVRSGNWEVVEFDGPVLELLSEARIRADRRLAHLGQDVLGETFDIGRFLARLRCDDPARPVGDALLEQRTVAGIGNLWKAEVCFAAGIDPWRTLGGVALAGAATGSGTSSTTTTPSTNGGGGPPPGFTPADAPGTAAHENAEKAVTGEAAAKAKAAALASVGGGTAGAVTGDLRNS